MTRWPCPASELPTLDVLFAEYRKVLGELHFTAHRAKLSGAPLLHLDIYKVCVDLCLYSMSQCGFAGTVFSPLPHIHPTLYMMHTLNLASKSLQYITSSMLVSLCGQIQTQVPKAVLFSRTPHFPLAFYLAASCPPCPSSIFALYPCLSFSSHLHRSCSCNSCMITLPKDLFSFLDNLSIVQLGQI